MKAIQPANRVNSVKEYYFSLKLKEIAKMQKEGNNIINLGIGNPDLPPSELTLETLHKESLNPKNHGYQSYIGIPELREAFAGWYKQFYDITINAETEILPLLGSKEGILHISMAFLNPGDGVLVPNPGYPTYNSVSQLVGADIIKYDLDETNNWWPDLDALEKLDLSNIKLMWVNYPNMPTGAPASIELFEKLVAFGKRHGIVICNDNPYSFILTEKPTTIFSVEGAKDIAIELNSLSKSHNMAGWRIGMVTANADFIQYILRVKSNVDSGMFKPMQLAASKALLSDQSWYNSVNATYLERRKVVYKIMDAIGCKYDTNQVGLFVWAKITDDSIEAEALSDKLLYNANVFITPGFIFGERGERYMRISLCSDTEVYEEALKRINAI